MRRVFVAAAVVCVTASAAGTANAAGFAAARFGGEHGNVVESNPTALYFNPGAIAFSEGIHLYLGGDIALRQATWDHPATDPDPNLPMNAGIGNSGKAHLFDVFSGPTLAATAKFGNLALGVGLFVPFAGRVHWAKDSAYSSFPSDQTCGGDGACTLAANGPQRWHMTDAELTFISVTAGLAYRLGPIGIGATFNFYNSTVSESQGRTFTGSIDSTAENTGTLNVSGNNASFGLGAMVEVVPDHLWLGASYQAKPGLGEQRLTGTLQYVNGPAPYYPQSGGATYDVSLHETLPDIVRAGVRLRPTDDFEIRAFGDLTRWSAMTSQCVNDNKGGPDCLVRADGSAANKTAVLTNIPRNWKDTYGARLGASYWFSHDVEIFAGAGYETGAAPDSTMEPGAMDGDNVAGALGGRFFLFDSFYFAASYTHIQFLDRTVTTSTLAEKNGKPVQYPTVQQDGNGTYTQFIGIVDLNIEKQF